MTRRILILLASFAVLLGAFLAYRHFSAVPGSSGGKRPTSPKDPAIMVSLSTSMPTKPNAPTFGPGTKLRVDARDRSGRLQYTLESPKWDRDTDGSWVMDKPVVTWYQRGGTVVVIRGDKGRIFAEETKDNVKINSGSLAGNVLVVIDRNANQQLSLDDRPKDRIEIRMDDVSFDNNRMEISTPRSVTVESDQADFEGTGLTMNFNESPSELRRLRLEQGRKIVIKDEGILISTPGGSAAAGSSVAPVAGSTGGNIGRTPGTKPSPSTVPVTAVAGAIEPGVLERLKSDSLQDMATELEAILPQPAADTTGAKKGPPARNIYLAQLEDGDNKLNITSESGSLQNARKVAMLFDWSGQTKTPPSAERTAATAPAIRPAASAPAGRAAANQAPAKARKPTVITWSGPLEMRPVGYVPKPNKKKYEVHAQGENLTLADKQSIVTCRQVFFRQPGQTGKLIGTKDKKVCITLTSGELVMAESVTFNRSAGVADLNGPGRITQPYRGGGTFDLASGGETRATTVPADASDDTISWTKSVAVLFGEAISGTGPAARIKQYIKEATFYGDVELNRPATGDSMKCNDNLHVNMARTEQGKNTISRSVAVGDVQARYEKNDIRGQKLVMDFVAVRNNAGKLQNRPATMEITGDVTVITTEERKDPKAPTKQPVITRSTATADRIVADARNLTADLYGRPGCDARIEQDQKVVSGGKIHIVARERKTAAGNVRELVSAKVDGPGTALFPIDRDPLSNARFAKARPAALTWKKFMNYDGLKNETDVKGDVHLDSDLDKMVCQSVHLEFDRAAADPAQPAEGKGLATEIGSFGSRRIARIVADGGVKVDSRSLDEKGFAKNLLQLECPNLTYTAADKTMLVDGAGTMLVGDFKQPLDKKKPSADASGDVLGGQSLQSPSASAFAWQKMMKLTQIVSTDAKEDGKRIVVMDGDAAMIHRSGLQLELTDNEKKKWNVMQWRDLPQGRHIVLGCDNLEATFDKAIEKSSTTQPDLAQQGPRMGSLRNFHAVKDVNLKDGQLQVLGQRLLYDVKDIDGDELDVAQIFGYGANQRTKTLAQIISVNPKTGRLQQQQAPEIVWERRWERMWDSKTGKFTGKFTDKITTSDVSAGGGR